MWKLHKKDKITDSSEPVVPAPHYNAGLEPNPPNPKLHRLRSKLFRVLTLGGHSRLITPLVIVIGTAGLGTYFLFFSHAQSGFAGQWDPLSGVFNAGGPAVSSWGQGRLDVFGRGTNNSVYHKYYDAGAWSPVWTNLGGTTNYGPAAVSWGANRIDVFHVGTNCHLYHGWWDGVSWHLWEDLGGCLTSAPFVSSWGPGRLDVFGRGTDNSLQHTWYDSSTGGWHGWQSLSGCLNGAGGATSMGANRIDIVVRGCDDAVYHKYYDKAAGGWENGFDSLGGVTHSAPSISSWPGHLDVWVRDTTNRVEYKSWDSSGWSSWQNNVGGQTNDAPAAVSWAPGRVDIFVIGSTDNSMWHTYYAPISNSIGSSIAIGQNIPYGYALYSPSYRYQAIMQYDGNFVVRDMSTANAVWATGTNGSGSTEVDFQTDGNLVVRPSGGAAAWASGTNTYCGTTLNMQDDGNLVQYAIDGTAVWSLSTGKIGQACATASLDGPKAVPSGTSPTLYISSARATSCTLNGVAVTTNGSVVEPAIVSNTTYSLVCGGPTGSASDSLVTQAEYTTNPDDIIPPDDSTSASAASAGSSVSYTQPTHLSAHSNWTGFVISGHPGKYTEVEGSFKVPSYSCPQANVPAAATFIWLGLDGLVQVGGVDDASNSSVEQVGINLHCTYLKHGSPEKHIYPFWEMWNMKHDRQQQLKNFDGLIHTGDQINMKVWYNPSNLKYGLYLYDVTNPSVHFTKYQTCSAGVNCLNRTAEWIVERPKMNFSSGYSYYSPFVKFNPITFTGAYASTSLTYNGYPFSNYTNYPYNIKNAFSSYYLVSLPSSVNAGVSSFTDTFQYSQ